jgi:hypothetical protein
MMIKKDLAVIKTGSWFADVPNGHVRIGISRGAPRRKGLVFKRYPALNPGPWFRSVPPAEYTRRYFDEVLSRLDAQEVVNDLIARANGQIPVLVCFEPPPPDPQWCHRGLVSAWLHDELGLRIPEVGHEDLGFGWAHPKLDPCLFR